MTSNLYSWECHSSQVVPWGDSMGPGEQLGLKCHPEKQSGMTQASHATLGLLEKLVLQEPHLGSLPNFFLNIYLSGCTRS